MHAGIYARISDDRSGLSLGVRRQEADCRALAREKGWTVVQTYVDNDLSAYSGRRRPAYERMIRDLESGAIDAIVVWHLDRLHRHPRELEDFIALCDARRTALASVSGDIDLSTADGRLMARIQGAVARKESEDKSRRIRRKHQEIAEQGRFGGGGLRPYGYAEDRIQIVDSEAAALREAVARILAGDTLRSIALDFNRRAIKSARGGTWSNVALRNILLSPRIAGFRSHRGQVVADAIWPAVIAEKDWRRVRALLTDPARRTSPLHPVKHLLSGDLLHCGRCGYRLFAVYGALPRRVRRYGCLPQGSGKGCERTYIMADPLDQFIVQAVFIRLDSPRLRAGRPERSSVNVLETAVADDQALLDDLARALGERRISMSEWLAARPPIEARIANGTQELRSITVDSAISDMATAGVALRETWDTLSIDRRRAVIRSVMDHAVILPAQPGRKTFDPNRVDPVWRS